MDCGKTRSYFLQIFTVAIYLLFICLHVQLISSVLNLLIYTLPDPSSQSNFSLIS